MDKYADQKNGKLFYEEHGEGSPLLLIHGGLGAASHWANQTAVFSEKFRVLIPEQRGRGRTPDIAGPITYQNMTEDMVEFLENQVDGPAVLVGASDGGIVGLYLAIQRPELISKLVLLGTNFDKDGVVLAFAEALIDWDTEADSFTRARELY
ncbi:MAG: alpha/beta hydrolase, partial [Deltaproteobacteria bacterium]